LSVTFVYILTVAVAYGTPAGYSFQHAAACGALCAPAPTIRLSF
jgi:hypothetical protein